MVEEMPPPTVEDFGSLPLDLPKGSPPLPLPEEAQAPQEQAPGASVTISMCLTSRSTRRSRRSLTNWSFLVWWGDWRRLAGWSLLTCRSKRNRRSTCYARSGIEYLR